MNRMVGNISTALGLNDTFSKVDVCRPILSPMLGLEILLQTP